MSREDRERIGDYVLGEGSEAERALMLARLHDDAELRGRVEGLQGLAGVLESLPTSAWETLGARPRPVERRVLRLRPALAAAACALLLAIGVGIGVLVERPGSSAGPTVALQPLGGASSARASARMTAGGRMLLTVEHLPVTAPGRFYELWLMNSTSDLVSVASFRVGSDGRAELNVPLPVSASRYHFLDISLQQAAAGPAHSGDSVLRAPIPA